MALPQILLPYGTPPFLRDTHELETISLYANTQVQTGAAIRRRMWVSAPRYANVVLELSTPLMEDFDEFYEETLGGGVKKFSAQVQNQGPGLLWWSCRFFEPYTVEYLGGLWWRVSAKLILFDEGSEDGPEPTTLVGSVRVDLQATALLVVEQPLSGSVTIALEFNPNITALSGSVVAALEYATYFGPAPVGSAAGTSTVLGVKAGPLVAAAAGTSTASAVGRGVASTVGSSAGAAVASGVGGSNVGVGSAAGTSTANAVGPAEYLLLEDGVSYLLLEDGVSKLILG